MATEFLPRNTPQIAPGANYKESELPLSAAQLGIWYAQELAPLSADFNSAEYVKIFGPVNPEIFETALRRVVGEADVLSVRFVRYAEGPRQVIGDSRDCPLSFIDVSAEPNPLAAARAWMDADRVRPIDPWRGPLFAYALFKAATNRFYWYARYHHILLDARGRWLIASRLAHVYSALATGLQPDDSTLGSLSVLLEDAAAYRASNDFLSDRQYWLKTLADQPEPTSISARPFIASNGFIRVDGYVPHSTVMQLRTIVPGVSLPRIITAATAMFVHLMTRAEDLVLGFQVAARVNPATQNVPGIATNLVPVRVTVRPDMSVSECARQTAEQIREVLRHQRYRIADLRRDLGRIGDDRPICTPLVNFVPFDYNFVYSGYRTSTHNLSPGPVEDLSIRIYDSSDGNDLLMSFYANPALYDTGALTEHQQRFLRLLSALTDPDAPVGRLDIFAPAERRRPLVEWSDTQADYARDKCIDELFVTQAERTPNEVAVVFENQSLSYGELNRRANNLAGHLRARGVGPNVLVGLYVPRSLDMIVGLLGILKAGGAYVPLDPSYPRDRLAFMLADAQPLLLLTHSTLRGQLAPHKTEEVYLNDFIAHMPDGDEQPASDKRQAEDLAYVIYTSGSTGQPKGVMANHHNVVRLLSATEQWFHFNSADVWTMFHSYAFDFSVWEIWGCLLTGGRLVVVPYPVTRSPQDFYDLLSREQITVLNQTPTALYQLIQHEEIAGSKHLSLRYVILGGEALNFASLRPWIERHGDQSPQLINMYGITETTVHVTYRPLKASDVKAESRSLIGKPIPDLRLYLLDANRRIVPPGVVGEIYVGGAGVTRGYLNRAELTAERFVEDPFAEQASARMYKSGDLARSSSNGDLEYLGRVDHQVKIRGYRIELREIEAVLNLHTAVRESVVVVQQDGEGDKKLLAYVVLAGSLSALIGELRDSLTQKLPTYMLPSTIVALDAFPLTPNGKLDRKALSSSAAVSLHPDESHVSARTSTEEALAGLWRDILKLDRIGIHDDFFDLGGHSLMIARLITRINSTFKVTLRFLEIFQHPTIAQMATLIAERQPMGREGTMVVQLQRGKAGPPVYFINGGRDEVRLAQLMGEERPVFGIEVPWPLAWHKATFNDQTFVLPNLEQLVVPHVETVVAQTGSSSCVLAGYSFGGLMAFEAAHQLQRSGVKVEMVMLLDSWLRSPPRYLAILNKWQHDWKEVLNKQAQNHTDGSIGYLKKLWLFVAMLAQKANTMVRLSKTIFSLSEDAVLAKSIELSKIGEPDVTIDIDRLYRLFSDSRKSYVPRPIDVRGVLFVAEDDWKFRILDRSRGWKNLFSKGLDIVPVPGNHISMIRHQPQNALLAQKMDEALNRMSRPEMEHTCPQNLPNDSGG